MSDEDAVREALLESAVEDLTGVYEAWWTANSLLPAQPLSARLALAEKALQDLLSRGLVTLSRGSWKQQALVPQDDVAPLLREYGTWVVGDETNRVFFEATEAGRLAYELQ